MTFVHLNNDIYEDEAVSKTIKNRKKAKRQKAVGTRLWFW